MYRMPLFSVGKNLFMQILRKSLDNWCSINTLELSIIIHIFELIFAI